MQIGTRAKQLARLRGHCGGIAEALPFCYANHLTRHREPWLNEDMTLLLRTSTSDLSSSLLNARLADAAQHYQHIFHALPLCCLDSARVLLNLFTVCATCKRQPTATSFVSFLFCQTEHMQYLFSTNKNHLQMKPQKAAACTLT